MPGTTVAPSCLPDAGDGLFAKQHFSDGDSIATYDGDQHSFEDADEAKALAQSLADAGNTMVLLLDDVVIDGSKGTQGAQYANHRPKSEANTRMVGNKLYATRDIAVGEEICWCYGPHFGADGKLKPTHECHKKRTDDDPPARKGFSQKNNPVRGPARSIIAKRQCAA